MAALIVASASTAWAEPRIWEYRGAGEWKQAETRPSGNQVISNPTLDRAEQLLDARRTRQAHDFLVSWLKSNPKAPDRDRGLFLLAEAYYAHGDRYWCFYQCDELLTNYPESRLFFPSLELQYRVADDFLSGRFKKRLLGFITLPNQEDDAIEMLYRVQERSPGSALAERALLRTADYYYHTSQFDLAADAYGAYARSYSRSPEVPRVRLAQAFSNFAQFRGVRYDATPLLDSRAQFQDIIARYPDLARAENVQQFIDRINALLAQKIYVNADFYRRTNQPKAAVFLYRSLIKTYPQSHDAQAAQRDLARMPRWALADPQPPATAEMPTSRPTLDR